jgi:hypothetical protein
MQVIRQPRDNPLISLGQRRGISELARPFLDLTWAEKRAESATTAPSGVYPSPPMSGSPPLPPKATQEAGDRSQAQGIYQTTRQEDVYRGAPAQSTQAEDARGQLPAATATLQPPSARAYPPLPPEPAERMGYYHRPSDHVARGYPYPPPGGQPPPQQQQFYAPMTGQASQQAYPISSRPPTNEPIPLGSPKPSRKAKGHVASACVPCKKAHLKYETPNYCILQKNNTRFRMAALTACNIRCDGTCACKFPSANLNFLHISRDPLYDMASASGCTGIRPPSAPVKAPWCEGELTSPITKRFLSRLDAALTRGRRKGCDHQK